LSDQICEALWCEQDPGLARAALKAALTALRHVLAGDHYGTKTHKGEDPRLPQRRKLIRLTLYPGDWIDLHEFLAPGDIGRLPISALTETADLHVGELLPEFLYEEWTMRERDSCLIRWRAMTVHLASRLAEDRLWDAAVDRLTALLEADPAHEEAARLLIHALVQSERPDEARQVYARLVASLEDELGVAPDSLTMALAKDLQRVSPPSPPAELPPKERADRLLHEIRRTPGKRTTPAVARRLARLWAERALVLETLGESEYALMSVESGQLAIGGLDLKAERSRLLIAQSTVRWHQGHADLALRAAEEAGRLARDVGERGVEAWAMRLQAQAAQLAGHLDDAIALARRSAALYEALGAAEHALRSRRIEALCIWHAARFGEAAVLFRANFLEATRLNHVEHRAYSLCGLGSSLLAQGDLEAAEPHLEEAISLAADLCDRFLELSAEYHLANLWTQRWYVSTQLHGVDGESMEAKATVRFQRAMHMAKAQNSDFMQAFACLDLALASVEWGRIDQARALAAAAHSIAMEVGDNALVQGWCALCEAEAALADGRVDEARAKVLPAIPLLESASPAGVAQAHRIAARCCPRDSEQFRTHAALSLAAATRYGQVLEELRTRRLVNGP
jgi:DNA-binding SARP family transcriptional activator